MPRCLARTRTAGGWARCHLDAGHDGSHHASDREWHDAHSPVLRFTPPCSCQPDDMLSYFGTAVKDTCRTGANRSGWPSSWKGGEPGVTRVNLRFRRSKP